MLILNAKARRRSTERHTSARPCSRSKMWDRLTPDRSRKTATEYPRSRRSWRKRRPKRTLRGGMAHCRISGSDNRTGMADLY
jgi:hypothetical protein